MQTNSKQEGWVKNERRVLCTMCYPLQSCNEWTNRGRGLVLYRLRKLFAGDEEQEVSYLAGSGTKSLVYFFSSFFFARGKALPRAGFCCLRALRWEPVVRIWPGVAPGCKRQAGEMEAAEEPQRWAVKRTHLPFLARLPRKP